MSIEKHEYTIIFQYKDVEIIPVVDKNLSLEGLIQNLKLHFKLPRDTVIGFFDLIKNRPSFPSTTSNLLYTDENIIPKYQLIVEEDEYIQLAGWLKWFWEKYIPKFLKSNTRDQQQKID